MKFGLTDNTIQKIKTVFSNFSEIDQALLYGSRAKGNFKEGSDIDITFKGPQLTHHLLNQISSSLDELLLPYTMDLSLLSHIENQDLVDHINRIGIVFYDKDIPHTPFTV